MPIYRKGELFNGPGGLAWGASNARFVDENGEEFRVRHEWANDFDETSCETYRRNICPERPETVICGPVQDLDITTLPPIDAFAFGFPCNDFSVVGEHRGMDGNFGGLYWHGVQVLRHHRPQWFIAENVGGLQSANQGRAFLQIMKDLIESGYRIYPHLYKFEEYGVPQTRKRIIIVGIRNDIERVFRIPAPTHLNNFITAEHALMNIPEDAVNHEIPVHNERVTTMLRYIPEGENAWSEEIPEEHRLNVRGARLSNIYRRLDRNQPSYTVTGSGGGGTHVYHWEEHRALSNRERARLQTFPDDFVFEGSREKVRRQVGMAVPPKAAQVIVEAILKTMAGVDYPVDPRGPKWTQSEIEEMIINHFGQMTIV
ncbi:DNA cytosine methyltransferase [Mesobacillus maritimus]|uniref:DNA cytosine methyltransferase n=1 Tax=Mesobacillus maritimus TaxID=1643336 RepID=UPI00384AA3A5